MARAPKYVLITPARNEEAYIEKTVKSVVSQTILPEKWIIVSDGSTDSTDEIVKQYEKDYDFIQFLRREPDTSRNFGSKVYAIREGVALLKSVEYDFIGNLDADVSFEPSYYERVLAKFQEDLELGIAGGIPLECYSKKWVLPVMSISWTVRGAIQMFRRQCYEDIGGYIPLRRGGIDAIAEVMARMHGWKIRSFPDIKAFHNGGARPPNGNILLGRFRMGMRDYSYGSHSLFEISKCIWRLKEKPYMLGSLFRLSGYFCASLIRIQRDVPADVVKFLRKEQMERLRKVFKKINEFDKRMTRISMVVFSYYPADPRPRREAEALAEIGTTVDVFCLRAPGEPRKEFVNGVCVYRLPLRRKRAGKLRYLWEYAYFILLSFFKLSMLHIHKHYDLVHVHNMPDILVISALMPRLMGCKIILDLHDPMPEVYVAKYHIKKTHPAIRFLCLTEKFSIWFSDLVLTPNIAFRELFISRGCPEEKIHVVMNSPQESIFHRINTNTNQNMGNNDKFVIMYHGTIVERNGLGVVLKALDCLCRKVPNIVFQVYGDGDFRCQFEKLVVELGLGDIVDYFGHVPLEEIPCAIQAADVGLIPNKPSIHWEHAMPTRIFEYLCLGKPVIAPRTKGILDYFDEESMHFFESGDPESLADTVYKVYKNPAGNGAVLKRGIAVYKKHRWQLQRQHFVELLSALVDNV